MSGATVSDFDEGWVISTVRDACDALDTPWGPGDDAAVLAQKAGATRVITTDALIEGVHFLRRHPPEALGWKCLAVNLSDLAAMGASPSEWLLTVALPPTLPAAFWQRVAIGMGACARRYGAVLVGGDTCCAAGPMMVSITALGTLPADQPALTRSGGRPDDVLMTLGPIGRSGLGLARWLADTTDTTDTTDPAIVAHLRPTPDLDAGVFARAEGATAAMDLSDGLATDLPRLAAASGVVLEVDLDALPSDLVCAGITAIERAVTGEDYGLVVLVPPDHVARFEARGFTRLGCALHLRDGKASVVWRSGGVVIASPRPSFTHF